MVSGREDQDLCGCSALYEPTPVGSTEHVVGGGLPIISDAPVPEYPIVAADPEPGAVLSALLAAMGGCVWKARRGTGQPALRGGHVYRQVGGHRR